MRELTLAELELISGGSSTTEVDGIVVVADGGGGGDWGDWGDGGDWGDSDGSGDSGDGGGDTAPPSQADWLQGACAADHAADVKAREIAALIKAQPDWNAREYGAVIYVTAAGEFKIGPLTTGMTVAEAIRAGLDAPETRLQIPDLEGGFIVSVVHSHPDLGYNNADDIENRYPSYYVGSNGAPGGDYATFDQLVGSGMSPNDPRFANIAAFSQYILGPDGVLREFNLSEGRVTSSNDTNPNSRHNLAADRPCS